MNNWQQIAAIICVSMVLANSHVYSQTKSSSPELSEERGDNVSSPMLRATLRDFEEWASVQKTYDAEQVKQIRTRLIEKASNLSGDDLEAFLDNVNERLQILMSAEAKEARLWLTKTLATAADVRVEKIKAKLPDVAKLSASQLEEELKLFEARRSSQEKSYADFNTTRKAQIDSLQAEKRRQEVAKSRARSNNAGYSGYVPSSSAHDHKRTPLPSYHYGIRW